VVVHRHGRNTASSTSAEKPTRSALVPCAPISGNSCLAKEVPTDRAVTEPRTARTGISEAWREVDIAPS